MIGTIIVIVIVVAVLALAAGTIAATRSRRRGRGATGTTTLPAPPSPPPESAPAAPATVVEAQPVVAPAAPEAPPAAPPSYRSRLGGVRGLFSGAVSVLRSGRIDAATWESLEEALIRADVGVGTTNALLDELRAKVDAKEISGGTDLLEALGTSIRQLLGHV